MIRGLAPGPRRIAFAAFAREIMSASALANNRVVKRWLLFDGKSPVSEPTVDSMPCARIISIGGEVDRLATVGAAITNRYSPTVRIDLWLPGTDQGDLADVGDAIEDALRPPDAVARRAVAGRLAAVGIMDWQLARDLAPPDPSSLDLEHVHGVAEYRLVINLTS